MINIGNYQTSITVGSSVFTTEILDWNYSYSQGEDSGLVGISGEVTLRDNGSIIFNPKLNVPLTLQGQTTVIQVESNTLCTLVLSGYQYQVTEIGDRILKLMFMDALSYANSRSFVGEELEGIDVCPGVITSKHSLLLAGLGVLGISFGGTITLPGTIRNRIYDGGASIVSALSDLCRDEGYFLWINRLGVAQLGSLSKVLGGAITSIDGRDTIASTNVSSSSPVPEKVTATGAIDYYVETNGSFTTETYEPIDASSVANNTAGWSSFQTILTETFEFNGDPAWYRDETRSAPQAFAYKNPEMGAYSIIYYTSNHRKYYNKVNKCIDKSGKEGLLLREEKTCVIDAGTYADYYADNPDSSFDRNNGMISNKKVYYFYDNTNRLSKKTTIQTSPFIAAWSSLKDVIGSNPLNNSYVSFTETIYWQEIKPGVWSQRTITGKPLFETDPEAAKKTDRLDRRLALVNSLEVSQANGAAFGTQFAPPEAERMTPRYRITSAIAREVVGSVLITGQLKKEERVVSFSSLPHRSGVAPTQQTSEYLPSGELNGRARTYLAFIQQKHQVQSIIQAYDSSFVLNWEPLQRSVYYDYGDTIQDTVSILGGTSGLSLTYEDNALVMGMSLCRSGAQSGEITANPQNITVITNGTTTATLTVPFNSPLPAGTTVIINGLPYVIAIDHPGGIATPLQLTTPVPSGTFTLTTPPSIQQPIVQGFVFRFNTTIRLNTGVSRDTPADYIVHTYTTGLRINHLLRTATLLSPGLRVNQIVPYGVTQGIKIGQSAWKAYQMIPGIRIYRVNYPNPIRTMFRFSGKGGRGAAGDMEATYRVSGRGAAGYSDQMDTNLRVSGAEAVGQSDDLNVDIRISGAGNVGQTQTSEVDMRVSGAATI